MSGEVELSEKLAYSIQETARLLGIGRSMAYELVEQGRLRGAIRLGKRFIVSRRALENALGIEGARVSGDTEKTVKATTGHQETNLTINLPEDKLTQFKALAREMDVDPGTLARIWLLESLRQQARAPS